MKICSISPFELRDSIPLASLFVIAVRRYVNQPNEKKGASNVTSLSSKGGVFK